MTYASTVWGYADKSHLKQLQTTQNIAIRKAMRSPYFVTNERLHTDAKMEKIEEFIHRMAVKFYEDLKNSDNPIIKNLGNYELESHPRYKRPKWILNKPNNNSDSDDDDDDENPKP